LKQSDAVALFLIDKFRSSDYFAMVHEAVPELAGDLAGGLASRDYPRLRNVVSLTEHPAAGMQGWQGFLDLGRAMSDESLAAIEKGLAACDPINIQYTSGTTGFPKGAMLTHRNILLNAYYVGDCQKFSEQDGVCISVPFYHCFGCVLGTLCAAIYGAKMVVPHEYFRPEENLAAIEQDRATAVYGVPTMYIAMLDHPTRRDRDLSSLRT